MKQARREKSFAELYGCHVLAGLAISRTPVTAKHDTSILCRVSEGISMEFRFE